MAMGEAGDYDFIAAGGNRIGATMKQRDKQPKGWMFYFRVPDIDAAVEGESERRAARTGQSAMRPRLSLKCLLATSRK